MKVKNPTKTHLRFEVCGTKYDMPPNSEADMSQLQFELVCLRGTPICDLKGHRHKLPEVVSSATSGKTASMKDLREEAGIEDEDGMDGEVEETEEVSASLKR